MIISATAITTVAAAILPATLFNVCKLQHCLADVKFSINNSVAVNIKFIKC